MSCHRRLAIVGIALAYWTMSALSTHAGPITVANFSFEEPALADGAFNTGTVSSWSLSGVGGGGGVFNPIAGTHFTNEVPDGSQTLYLNQGTASQVLSAVLTANTQYTLLVNVGRRLPPTAFPGYTVGLLAGSTPLGIESSLMPAEGAFATSTITYTALGTDPLLGQPLQIRFTSVTTQTNFDNVHLIATAVPEPATLVLAMNGLLVAGALRIARRWRRPRVARQFEVM
jgi:hypothetical protein